MTDHPQPPAVPCGRHGDRPKATNCRICWQALCDDCRIDHHHEGYDTSWENIR